MEILLTIVGLLLFYSTGCYAQGSRFCPDVPNKNETTFVVGESCFHIRDGGDLRLSWTAAENDCKSRNGHLFSVTSQEIQDAVYAKIDLQSSTHLLWIGLRKTHGQWTWVNGNSLTYENWDADGDQSQGSCAIYDQSKGGAWRSNMCSEDHWYYAFICEHNHGGLGIHRSSFLGILTALLPTTLFFTIFYN